MADEITLTAILQVIKASVKHEIRVPANSGVTKHTWTGQTFAHNSQVLSTTAENINIGEIGVANLGYAFFQNADSSIAIDIGHDDAGTFKPLITLNAGQIALFPFKASVTPQAKAASGTPLLNTYVYSR